jgi:hypothetical protein
VAIGEALSAANKRHMERRDRARRSRNAAANKAAAARWVGKPGESQMTAEELAAHLHGLKKDFYRRHPEPAA